MKAQMKTTANTRNTRALRRSLDKINKELSRTKQNAKSFRTAVFKAKKDYSIQLNTEKTDNDILRKSLRNFSVTCRNQQKELRMLKVYMKQHALWRNVELSLRYKFNLLFF